jgi:hypothetical protein
MRHQKLLRASRPAPRSGVAMRHQKLSPGAIKLQKQSQGPKQAAGVPPLQAICEE